MGTFVRAGLAVAVLACVAGADGPPPPLKEEGDRLKGTWVNRGPDHEWQIYFGPGRTVQISLKGPEAGLARNAHGPLSEVKDLDADDIDSGNFGVE